MSGRSSASLSSSCVVRVRVRVRVRVGIRVRVGVRVEVRVPQQLLRGAQPPLLAQVVVTHVDLVEHKVREGYG